MAIRAISIEQLGRAMQLGSCRSTEIVMSRMPAPGVTVEVKKRGRVRLMEERESAEDVMRISERHVGDVTVLDLVGKLTLTDGPGRVKDKVTSLVYQGHRRIVLNLADITYVDSSGLGELVACHLTAERGGGGCIKLANAGYRMQDLLVLTKLLTIFESHRSEAAAINSFSRAALPPAQESQEVLWSRIF